MLTAALHRVLQEDPLDKASILGHTDRSLWLLAHLIFLHRHSLGGNESFSGFQETNYIKLLSAILAVQANEITQRIDITDHSKADPAKRRISGRSDGQSSTPLPHFVREQILTLVEKSSIVGIMSQIGLPKSTEQRTDSDSAQTLATYALTLTRVFPGQRADDIRLSLYDGSAKLKASTGTSAMIYFWHYSRSTALFNKICQDHRNAVPLLRSFLGVEKSMPGPALETIQREWRTLLLFLELYSFAIRHMDDEEFLAGGKFGSAGSTQWGVKIRESSLPLREVRDLVTFLKNLAFALYWNAKDLQDRDNTEQSAGLGAYFGTAASSPPRQAPAASGDTSQESARIQLRDVVTGLLRSIHQRE